MNRNPSSILYDAYGNPVATLDGYNLLSTSPGYPVMLQDANGKAAFLKADSDGYVYITSPVLENTDFATETTLVSLEGKDFATQATLLDAYDRLVEIEGKDFATETTLLDAYDKIVKIKDTDGIKKITDPLPIGDNNIGRVKLIDGYSTQVPTIDGYGLEATSPGIPVMGMGSYGDATFIQMDQDGYVLGTNRATLRDQYGSFIGVTDLDGYNRLQVDAKLSGLSRVINVDEDDNTIAVRKYGSQYYIFVRDLKQLHVLQEIRDELKRIRIFMDQVVD